MNTLSDLLSRLRAFVAALSPRERAGVMLVTALASLAAAAATVDWAMDAQDAALDSAVRVAGVEATFAREGNRGYKEGVRLAAKAVEDWSIVEASEGVAQARAAGALRILANDAGLSSVVITANTAASSEEITGEVVPLSMTLSADFTWPGFMALLREIRSSTLVFEAEAVEVNSSDDGAQTFTMTLRAPFLRRAPQS